MRILNSTDGDMEVEIDFDGKPAHLLYGKKEMRDVELAYAITVHSSQGCEFPMCILPVSMSYGIMLTRAVYYTAITRAKTKLVLVGDQAALKRAIDNKRRGVRKSLLGPRIITKTKSTQRQMHHRKPQCRFSNSCFPDFRPHVRLDVRLFVSLQCVYI